MVLTPFGSDLYLPRCYNCQGALVKGERLWPGNGRLWDRSQLSLRSSKHIKGEDVEGPGLVIGKKYINHWIMISTVRHFFFLSRHLCRPNHFPPCSKATSSSNNASQVWMQKGFHGVGRRICYQKRKSKGCWFLSLLNTVKGPDFDRRSRLLNFCFYSGRLP